MKIVSWKQANEQASKGDTYCKCLYNAAYKYIFICLSFPNKTFNLLYNSHQTFVSSVMAVT